MLWCSTCVSDICLRRTELTQPHSGNREDSRQNIFILTVDALGIRYAPLFHPVNFVDSRRTGRCSFEAGHRHVDVSKVIWLGTSNIGHNLVFEHQAARDHPEEPLSREMYVDLMGMLRPAVSESLGVCYPVASDHLILTKRLSC